MYFMLIPTTKYNINTKYSVSVVTFLEVVVRGKDDNGSVSSCLGK